MCIKCNNPSDHRDSDKFTSLIPKTPTLIQPTQKPHKPTSHLSLLLQESVSIARIALPMILTGLLLYSRSIISMLFLGRLGDLALAGGSLAVGFANITGYSVLSGLAMGMEPICGQAFGAKKILLFCGQDESIAAQAQEYLFYSLPDLFAQAVLHPLRIYLRTQSITLPLTFCAAFSILLHVPINYLLVSKLELGIKGVAFAGVWTNINLVASLVVYIIVSGVYKKTWEGVSMECLKGWKSLLNLAIPSCVSVCLEWWWYEIMILICGLLLNPKATVASMGILIQTTALIYIFPSSLSFSVSTRVGNEIGAGRPQKAKFAAIVGLSGGFLLGFTAFLFAVSVRNIWATMFTQDKEIIALTSLVLPIIGLCELGNCPQTTGCGVLRGTARPKVGANINLGCFYLVGMPVAVGLAFFLRMDFQGLWFGLLAAQTSCMITMMVVLLLTDWESESRKAEELTKEYRILDRNEEDEKFGSDKAENKGDSQC
ncbi:protein DETOXIFICATION 49-like isoform X2 [Primulina eburnea]|uniref:protein DETOXIFICATION 49-like isoform X2 n=1 Tax=Primulina eburnea TaxID=1245227 RepID=UPI003C6C10A3